jgi:hypothetical protein
MSLAQNYDEGFLSLLSSQREILKRLNREKSSVANQSDGLRSTGQIGELTTHFTSNSVKHGLFADVSEPYCLMNEPIIERRLSQGELLLKAKSRRISGFGNLSTCTTPSSTDFIDYERQNKRTKITPKICFKTDALTSGRINADRHNRLYGMIANALVFDVDSITARKSSIHLRNPNESEIVPKEEGYKRAKRFDPNVDFATLRGEFESFVIAMEKSMKSQQDIHDWDRRMGLKMSHSKTMRLSMRSRDKLRQVTKV